MAHARAGAQQAGEEAQVLGRMAQMLENVVRIDAVEAHAGQSFALRHQAGLGLRGTGGLIGNDVPALCAQLLHGRGPGACAVVQVGAAWLGGKRLEGADFLLGGVAFRENSVVPVVFLI